MPNNSDSIQYKEKEIITKHLQNLLYKHKNDSKNEKKTLNAHMSSPPPLTLNIPHRNAHKRIEPLPPPKKKKKKGDLLKIPPLLFLAYRDQSCSHTYLPRHLSRYETQPPPTHLTHPPNPFPLFPNLYIVPPPHKISPKPGFITRGTGTGTVIPIS